MNNLVNWCFQLLLGFFQNFAEIISVKLACVAWWFKQFERERTVSLLGSSRLWRSLSRLPSFHSALKLLKNRQATQATGEIY